MFSAGVGVVVSDSGPVGPGSSHEEKGRCRRFWGGVVC